MDFTLTSTELREPKRHACEVISVLRPASGPAMLLVRVSPEISRWTYRYASSDLDVIVLAPRHAGVELAPMVSEWPCYVNMLIPAFGGDVEHGPYELLDIARIDKP